MLTQTPETQPVSDLPVENNCAGVPEASEGTGNTLPTVGIRSPRLYDRRGFLQGLVAMSGAFTVASVFGSRAATAGTTAGSPYGSPMAATQQEVATLQTEPFNFIYYDENGELVTEKLNRFVNVSVENDEAQTLIIKAQTESQAKAAELNASRSVPFDSRQELGQEEVIPGAELPQSVSNLYFQLTKEAYGGLQSPSDFLESKLREIYDYNKTELSLLVPSGSSLVEKKWDDLSNDEKGLIVSAIQPAIFFVYVTLLMRKNAKVVGLLEDVGLEKDVVKVEFVVDPTGSRVTGGYCGFTYLSDGKVQIQTGVVDRDDVLAEIPHVALPSTEFVVDSDNKVQIGKVGINGSAVATLTEGVSNLTHDKVIGREYPDYYPHLSYQGPAGMAVHQLLHQQKFFIDGSVSEEEYRIVQEARGYSLAMLVLDTIPNIGMLPNIMSNGKPNDMTEAEYNRLISTYAGVVGILRMVNVVTSNDFKVNNDHVSRYISQFPSDVQPSLNTLFSKLKEQNFISVVQGNAITDLKEGAISSSVSRNLSVSHRDLKEYVIQANSGKIDYTSGTDDAKLSAGNAMLRVPSEQNSQTKVMAKVTIDGRESYTDITNVCMFEERGNKVHMFIPDRVKIDGQWYQISDLIMVAEFTGDLTGDLTSVHGHKWTH